MIGSLFCRKAAERRMLRVVLGAALLGVPAALPARAQTESPAQTTPPPATSTPAAPLPLVIPRPKRMQRAHAPFPLTPRTRIVVADGASVDDKQGAEMLRRELRERFDRDIPLVRARDVVRAVDVIAVGEPGRNAVLDRLLVAEKTGPPPPDEGYTVRVTPRAVLVAGRDRAGSLWGVQTLIQLLERENDSVRVPAVHIEDWPTLALRGVHLFHGRDALPFHEKLIDRVLSRFKINTLVLQAEQIRWDADPAIAPAWAGTPAQIREEIAFARRRGITVYPLVQGMGHMEWLLANKQNRDLAEDPETPYALNLGNPRAADLLARIYAEADALFDAPAFHIGHDEVLMRGRFPFAATGGSFADRFLASVRHWHDFFARRGIETWMWADMALFPADVAPSFGTAPTAEDAARIRAALPRDIVMFDWQYTPRASYPSLKALKDAGFPVVAATWYDPEGIRRFSRAAAEIGARGALQTTWAGYESRESVLDTENRKQFTAMVLAAEYFWNGGDAPAPGDLPYTADAVFSRQWTDGESRADR